VSTVPGPPEPPRISYQRGLAVLTGVAPTDAPPWLVPDPRVGGLVAPGCRYPELRAWAALHGIAERGIAELSPGATTSFDAPLLDPRIPREAQQEALARWHAAGRRGTVVLPTGAGKTLVALLAIRDAATRACIVTPTRALVAQWFAQLADAFGAAAVGTFYGDEKVVAPLTVTTYHSAFTLLERHGADFPLLVCDEVHHLADTVDGTPSAFLDALTIAPAAHRLGLTATYPDGRDTGLRERLGPVVYRRAISEMTDDVLAAFATERRYVELTPAERARYDLATERFEGHAARSRWREASPDPTEAWKLFAASARRDPAARRALAAFHERERIVRLAERKVDEARRILGLFPGERAILFCGGTDAALQLSQRLAIPVITATTPAAERHAILRAMEDGTLRAVASVRVLDEGWDVPSAKLGIVLGDSTRGGRRQHVQRLGRILRRQGDQVATLFELVAAGTWEFFSAQKRGAGVKVVREPQLGFGL
jgi:superfamily II DNA or RNA helicase